MDKSIMPECFADTLLTETLVPTRIGYNHKMGCFKVESEMKFGRLSDQFAVGIIDDDKNKIKYLDEFIEVDRVEGSLILWKHELKHHFIIQICPALEKWILNVCADENIDMSEYGLPNDLGELMKLTKSLTSKSNPELQQLFEKMKGSSSIKIEKMKKWIQILKESGYECDINQLRNA